MTLVQQFELGLDAPICLTWELTYACNLACVHCLSSSGRRDPNELSTDEAKAVIDELQRMQVFYVNIGGGEPTIRNDFWELVDYATSHQVGVKFSTNGYRITPEVAQRLAASDYVDVQISLDGADSGINDDVRGAGSFDTAIRAMENLKAAGFKGFKLSVVCTRHNIPQLDEFKAIADKYDAQLRLTRLRPSGRGADRGARPPRAEGERSPREERQSRVSTSSSAPAPQESSESARSVESPDAPETPESPEPAVPQGPRDEQPEPVAEPMVEAPQDPQAAEPPSSAPAPETAAGTEEPSSTPAPTEESDEVDPNQLSLFDAPEADRT